VTRVQKLLEAYESQSEEEADTLTVAIQDWTADPLPMADPCPFCNPPADRIVDETRLVIALRDGYPVSAGHTLVIPRRHVGSFFDTTPAERAEILDAVARVKQVLDEQHAPLAYNVGINDGPAAGQTVAHCHVHVIPRYAGDVDDPRGGVRWVIPSKARYW